MIDIGCHLSVSKGYLAMGETMKKLGGSTFAFFTRNPRGGAAKEPVPEDVEALNRFLKDEHFGKLVAHAPYTMNLCSDKTHASEFAEQCFAEDLKKMELFPGNYFNFHPGNSLKQDREDCMDRIAAVLNRYMTPDQSTIVLLEAMAGKGSELGKTFEELAAMIARIDEDKRPKIGVCLDTCHIWDGGYDIRENLDAVLAEFDRVVGLDRLKACHLNDSKNVLGAHKDRHEKLGEGEIGAEALKRVVCHPLLQGRPFILETPNEMEGYRQEIAMVKQWETEECR